jgi:hypothetical protein
MAEVAMFALSLRLSSSLFRIAAGVVLLLALAAAVAGPVNQTGLIVLLMLAAAAVCWVVPDPWRVLHAKPVSQRGGSPAHMPGRIIDMPAGEESHTRSAGCPDEGDDVLARRP